MNKCIPLALCSNHQKYLLSSILRLLWKGSPTRRRCATPAFPSCSELAVLIFQPSSRRLYKDHCRVAGISVWGFMAAMR
eukprot:scaffold301_cov370-Pavlova_lutheri.AAC.26